MKNKGIIIGLGLLVLGIIAVVMIMGNKNNTGTTSTTVKSGLGNLNLGSILGSLSSAPTHKDDTTDDWGDEDLYRTNNINSAAIAADLNGNG
jgi:hypothetical protein